MLRNPQAARAAGACGREGARARLGDARVRHHLAPAKEDERVQLHARAAGHLRARLKVHPGGSICIHVLYNQHEQYRIEYMIHLRHFSQGKA